MTEDVIGTFKNTTPVANQKYDRKIQIDRSAYHMVSYSEIWYVDHVLLGNGILMPNVSEVCTLNNAKTNKQWPRRDRLY